MSPTRRGLLLGLGAAALLRPTKNARALGESSRFRIAELRLPGLGSSPRPRALARLLWEIDKRTSIDVGLERVELRLGDDTLFHHPLLYLAGDRAFPLPPPRELERLRRYLALGGLLLVDSAEGRIGGPFDTSARALLAAAAPAGAAPLAPLPADHVIFQSFYLVEAPTGRLALSPELEAIEHDGRVVAVHTQNDLGGAWARDDFGAWEHECHPGGERQRELAFRLGINLAMVALCLDYKTDQVHVPFLLKRRRWKAP